jgi:hypothetical protein
MQYDLQNAVRFQSPESSTMPNAKPLRNLTPALCQRVQVEMLKACQDVAARHGLVVDAKEVAGVDLRWGFDLAFRVSIPLPDGTALNPERLRFEALAEAYGLSAADYGRRVSNGRETFRIVGIDPRRPKYPVSAERIPDGQGFKFTADQVALLLQKGMRDVTPRE